MILRNLFISLLCLFLFSAASCRGTVPKWNGQLWAGDSSAGVIRRAQENAIIACTSKDFDNYLCMTYSDFKSFVETYVNGCKKWDASSEKIDPLILWQLYQFDLILKKAEEKK